MKNKLQSLLAISALVSGATLRAEHGMITSGGGYYEENPIFESDSERVAKIKRESQAKRDARNARVAKRMELGRKRK